MKLIKDNRGGIFEDIGSLAAGIAVLAITLIVTFIIIAQGRTQAAAAEGSNWSTDPSTCTSSYTCNATGTLRLAVADIPGWVPLVVIAFIGSIILGLVKMFK